MHTSRLRKHFSLTDLSIFLISTSFFLCAGFFHRSFSRPALIIPKQESALNFNHNFLVFMSIGNKRLISDFLWIQTLLEADLDHYKGNDLNSWMFLRFNNISQLDPKFYENYLYGGQLLSIAKDDLLGAEALFSQGLKYYPDDFELNYHSGFNLYFEMNDFKNGYERLKKVVNHPKASWTLKFLVNKLAFENTKNFDTTLAFLKFNRKITQDDFLREKLSKDIYALTAERDLMCLNSGSDNCTKEDAEGVPYIFRNGKWEAAKEFRLYRINRGFKNTPQE